MNKAAFGSNMHVQHRSCNMPEEIQTPFHLGRQGGLEHAYITAEDPSGLSPTVHVVQVRKAGAKPYSPAVSKRKYMCDQVSPVPSV